MTWSDFYLICFLVGFSLSLLSLLGGAFHLHLPGLDHGHGGHLGHGGHGGHAGHGGHTGSSLSSFFSIPSLCAFLAWFGGIGFLLSTYSGIWLWFAFAFALLGGLAGSAIVFWFLFKVLLANERPLDPLDYEMVGVFGKVTSAIRSSGTGEMTFSQVGARRSAAARSDHGDPIPKGADVIVTRYEKGIAYVRRWDEMADETAAHAAPEAAATRDSKETR